jgi:hypothetical protein
MTTNGSTNGTRPKSPVSQADRIKQLEADVKLQAWLYAELVYSVRAAFAQLFAQLAMANPQVQQQVQQQLAARLIQQGGHL